MGSVESLSLCVFLMFQTPSTLMMTTKIRLSRAHRWRHSRSLSWRHCCEQCVSGRARRGSVFRECSTLLRHTATRCLPSSSCVKTFPSGCSLRGCRNSLRCSTNPRRWPCSRSWSESRRRTPTPCSTHSHSAPSRTSSTRALLLESKQKESAKR